MSASQFITVVFMLLEESICIIMNVIFFFIFYGKKYWIVEIIMAISHKNLIFGLEALFLVFNDKVWLRLTQIIF